MKNLIAVIATVLSASVAMADGWVCRSVDGDLNVAVYNQLTGGNRNAGILVLSDPNVQAGRKTIAKFPSQGSLSNEGATYVAVNETEFGDEGGGEYVAGTRLGFVEKFVLRVAFSYADPVEDGTIVPASLRIVTERGSIVKRLECARYLKGAH